MQSAYHAVLAVKSETARFRGINGHLPADAGPLHLFHDGRPALDLCARRDREVRAIPPQQSLENDHEREISRVDGTPCLLGLRSII